MDINSGGWVDNSDDIKLKYTPPQLLENEWIHVKEKDKIEDIKENKTLISLLNNYRGGTCILWSTSIVSTIINYNLDPCYWYKLYIDNYTNKPIGSIQYIKEYIQKYLTLCDIKPSYIKIKQVDILIIKKYLKYKKYLI